MPNERRAAEPRFAAGAYKCSRCAVRAGPPVRQDRPRAPTAKRCLLIQGIDIEAGRPRCAPGLLRSVPGMRWLHEGIGARAPAGVIRVGMVTHLDPKLM